MGRSLTALSVERLLSRSGIEWHHLSITEEQTTSRIVDVHYSGPWETYTQVRIEGPRSKRGDACSALFAAGMAEIGYPEYSLFSRSSPYSRQRRSRRSAS